MRTIYMLDLKGVVSVIDFDRGARLRARAGGPPELAKPAALARQNIARMSARPISDENLGLVTGRRYGPNDAPPVLAAVLLCRAIRLCVVCAGLRNGVLLAGLAALRMGPPV